MHGAYDMNVTQNESRTERGFPCGMRPMSESADSLINTVESDCCSYLNDNLQTLGSKRMSHLLRHSATTEKVALTSQGYLNIAHLFKWLYRDIKVHITMADITNIVENDVKARYKIVNGQICAVNGHSLSLPLMTFDPYNHKIGGHPRYLVHETYMKCLPAIFKKGLSRMAKNYVHLSMQTEKAGLQKKSEPTIAIYVDVVKASEYGLAFQHCVNDVIMCSGDRNVLISLYFFECIRNTQTGALIEFVRLLAPLREDMLQPKIEDELDLPPPWGQQVLNPELC